MSGEAQLAAVKEYIAKYNLEDELSNGVNLAIKQNSDDPFRVISDYLRTLAKVPCPGGVNIRALFTFHVLVGAQRFVSACCCLLYTSPSPRDYAASRMPSSA